jgi:glyoxylase-like metal-dependent hydrolase (beta-lactamase superfamily II)
VKITENIYLVGSLQLGISGPWDCHTYVVKGPDGLVMIDAGGGGSGKLIVENMEKDGLRPEQLQAILITHNHFDHCCGAFEIKQLTGCKVFISSESKEMLEKGTAEDAGLPLAKELGIYPPEFIYRNCPVDYGLKDGDKLELGGNHFEAVSVEGHSPDSICFLTTINDIRHLFVGDVLFYGGVLGLINFPGSNMDGYRKDLKKLGSLRVEGLYPGHMLFTVKNGQKHIDAAIEQCNRSSIPRSVGQFELVF